MPAIPSATRNFALDQYRHATRAVTGQNRKAFREQRAGVPGCDTASGTIDDYLPDRRQARYRQSRRSTGGHRASFMESFAGANTVVRGQLQAFAFFQLTTRNVDRRPAASVPAPGSWSGPGLQTLRGFTIEFPLPADGPQPRHSVGDHEGLCRAGRSLARSPPVSTATTGHREEGLTAG